jgi:O-acetylhomoserine (thiol)-lyase
MDRHIQNARKVVAFLSESEAVEWVAYPELDSHPDKKLAARLMPKGAGSMIAFGIKGGREAGKTFIEALKIWSHLANVGDAKSLVIHPASTTHQQMDAETMKSAGLSEDLVRLSVGLEDPADLIADLHQALRAATPRKAG